MTALIIGGFDAPFPFSLIRAAKSLPLSGQRDVGRIHRCLDPVANDPEQTSTSWACPNEHHPPPRGRPLSTWQVTAMGAHEVGTLAALKAVPIRGAAPPRGQASSTARLATAQLCLLFTEVFRKGCLVKAGHSGKVVCPVEAKWIFCKTTSFLSCSQSAEPHADRGVGDAAEGG